MIVPMPNAHNNIPNNKRIEVLKAQLDTLIDNAEFWPASAQKDVRTVLEEAISNFKTGSAQLLNEATEYLWRYYQDVAGYSAPEELEEYDIPIIASQDEVWNYVQFRNAPTVAIGGENKYEPGRSYISFGGNVAWEEEHGLQLVFEHGLTVCKVGPYDGHYTNAHAFADEALIGIVYRQ